MQNLEKPHKAARSHHKAIYKPSTWKEPSVWTLRWGLSCISQTDYRSRGESWEPRRTLTGDNFETPGNPASLRRTPQCTPSSQSMGGKPVSRVWAILESG